MEFDKKLGEGRQSTAYLNGGRVYLVGKRQDSFANYLNVAQTLNLIEGRIKSVKIPEKAELIVQCNEFPNGALVTSFVPGTPLDERTGVTSAQKAAIGKTIAAFLTELDQIGGADKPSAIIYNNDKFKATIEKLSPFLTDAEAKKLAAVAAPFNKFLHKSTFGITHGDLQAKNLMVDDNNALVGIVDFGNSRILPREYDFALMNKDSEILASTLENYPRPIDMHDVKLANVALKSMRAARHPHALADAQKALAEFEI